MIFVENRFYPLAAESMLHYNSVLINPWTGDTWARIDRGRDFWQTMLMPPEGSKWYTSFPGTLCTNYDIRLHSQLEELPRALLDRELRIMAGFTSDQLSRYNWATIQQTHQANMTPTLLTEIAALRAKVADGSITDDELRRALRVLREERMTAGARVAASVKKAETVSPDAALAAFLA